MTVCTCDKCGKKVEIGMSTSLRDVEIDENTSCSLRYAFTKKDEFGFPMELCDECMAKLVAEANKKVGNMK